MRDDPADWRTWWRFNGEAYVDLKSWIGRLDRATGGDEFSPVDPSRRVTRGLSAALIEQHALPSVWSVVQAGGDTAMVRAALLALARLESSWKLGEGQSINWVAPQLLPNDHQETVEATLVALGVAGDARAIPTLIEILRDSEQGRATCKLKKVDFRRRAYAAYALALIGIEQRNAAERPAIVRALMENLHARATAPYDLQLASLIALGQLPLEGHADDAPDVDVPGHVCRGEQLSFLLAYVQDTRRHAQLRAQAVIPLARLCAGATDADYDAIRAALVAPIAERNKAPVELQQSCVIALGLLGDGDEDALDRDIRDVLVRMTQLGDRMSRSLALISLAKVVGRPGHGTNDGKALHEAQELLAGRLTRGDANQRAWAALALGVLGRTRAEFGQPTPPDAGTALRFALSSVRSKDEAGAHCIGLGLLRDRDARDALCERLQKNRELGTRPYAALALGLAGARDAIEPLQALFGGPDQETVDPSAALALRLLGQSSVVADLVARAEKRPMTAETERVARLLGTLGDARALPCLAKLAQDAKATPQVRGAAVEAIGEMCDLRPRHWTSFLSTDLHYGLLSSTLLSYSGNGSGVLEMR